MDVEVYGGILMVVCICGCRHVYDWVFMLMVGCIRGFGCG